MDDEVPFVEEQALYVLVRRCFIIGIHLVPVRTKLRLAQRLLEEGSDTLSKIGQALPVLCIKINWPMADQRLEDHPFNFRLRCELAFDLDNGIPLGLAPPLDQAGPSRDIFGKRKEPGASIFAALGVVG